MYNYTQLDSSEFKYVEITPASELPDGERMFVTIDDKSIVIFNIAGALFAIADRCSHDEGPLGDGDLENYGIICPRHGARFDVHTGQALGLPAVVDIPVYPIRVNGGMIEIGIPKK
jgi:3-phenylpropionate/trans-cinnamate dioxygenase ferredoxin subunit